MWNEIEEIKGRVTKLEKENQELKDSQAAILSLLDAPREEKRVNGKR